jgi:proteasome alpha subunit
VADARVLVDRARIESQVNKITYGENMPVEILVKKICDFKQNYTQYGGVRPFGTALLVAGVDEVGEHLFETDPSGALMAYKAGSIGAGRNVVMEIFEEKYKEKMTQDKSIELGLHALDTATEGGISPAAIEIGVVLRDKPFEKVAPARVEKYVESVKKGKK